MIAKISILLFLVLVTFTSAEYVSYKNYKVYKVLPRTDEEVEFLTNLQNTDGYSCWTLFDSVRVDKEVRVMVDPRNEEQFEGYIKSVGFEAEKAVDDVQSLIDDQLRRPQNVRRSALEYDWTYYPDLKEIEEWMVATAERHPNVVSLLDIGRSIEGRPIRGIKIDYKKREKPIIGVFEGTLHAREWITPVTLMYIANEFLNSRDADVRFFAENVVWHFLLVTNPDGFAFSFTDNRMWRKNRNPANFTTCPNGRHDRSVGVDLNRNFGFLWNTIGASPNPCDETFGGQSAFSEPEARAIANYVLSLKNEGELMYYMSFHSFGNMILVPYSHTRGPTVLEVPNYGDLFEIAIKGAEKLTAVHNTTYRVGTSADILYPVSGAGFDWAKGVAEIPIVHLFEVRDTGIYGFLLPPEQILPTSEEVLAGIVEMDRVTRKIGYYSAGNSYTFNLFLIIAAVMVALM